MTPERWQQIEEIFQNALDLPASEREAYIAEKCAGDDDLKTEVAKLLLQFEDASSFIETPAYENTQAGVLSSLMQFDEEDPMIGTLLGSYRIEREIGRGGMGAVYEAVRADGEFRRKVAIKVVKRGMDTDFILRRFRNERQILATLEHPYITRLLDGGTTNDGRPYFVMDYIEGLPLYRYCDKNRLTIRQRLSLFTKICEAVGYAHQNLVIHRDLKPSNILVTSDGTPRLLDFGIAKLLNPELSSDTLQPTATAMRMMTIDYASPEQVQGEKVTYSTDIYSLGVILFELLTGHRPYRYKNRTAHQIARAICESEPMLPSEAVSRSDYSLPIVHVDQEAITIRHLAELRKNSPHSLQEELQGNLDNITLKALRKLPEQRYDSIAKFRADIQKHLEGQPVSAPFAFPKKDKAVESNGTSKLIAVLPLKLLNFSVPQDTDENYLSIGLADAIIARLAGVRDFTVRPTSSIANYEKADTDPLRAGRELAVDFVLDGRIKKFGSKLRVSLQMLDVQKGATVWAGQFDEEFSDVLALEDAISEQVAEALVTQITGENHLKLGKRGTSNPNAYEAYLKGRFFWNLQTEEGFARSIEYFQQAVNLDPNYAQAYAAIAEHYIFLGIHCVIPFAQGSVAAKEAAEKAIQLDPTLAEGYAALGFAAISFELDWKKAEDLFQRAVELNPHSITAHFWYVAILGQSRRFDEALERLKLVLELDPGSLLGLHMVAWILYHARRYDESIAAHEKMLQNASTYAWGFKTYSWALRRVGRFEEAIANAQKAVQLTGENPMYLSALAMAYADAGMRGEAENLLRKLDEISQTRFVSEYMLALVYCALGDEERTFEYLEKSLAGPDGWLNWLGVEPQFDILRSDPRFEDLLRRSGNPLAKKAESADSPHAKSVAVLPLKLFSPPSDSTGDEYLSLGLTDALITRLSNVQRLTVRPTSSVLQFQNQMVSPFAAGRDLNVEYVVEGNIRRFGEMIRVSIQLLKVGEEAALWAKNFDEKFTDVLELEDLISEQIAKALIPRLTTTEQRKLSRRETNNAEAYQAYLRGRYFWNSFTPETFPRALESFEKAVELDPEYALAHVGIADYYNWATIFGFYTPRVGYQKTKAAVLRALEIDDQSAEAIAVLGFLTAFSDYDWEEAERLLKRSLELNPNYSLTHEWYSALLAGTGRNEEAYHEIMRSLGLDPLSLRAVTLTAWTLYQLRRYPEALAKVEELLEMNPTFYQGFFQRGNILNEIGRAEEAVEAGQKGLELAPNLGYMYYKLCFALTSLKRDDEAWELLRKYEAISPAPEINSYHLGMCYAALGERETAFKWFNKAVEDRHPWCVWLATDAKLDALRDDERFNELLRKSNRAHLVRKIAAPTKTDATQTLAVLPLKVNSLTKDGDTEEKFLGVGLTDALITRLSKTRQLIVRPTGSILRFEDAADAFAAGKELNVKFVLNGSIRHIGERVRVSVQLLDIERNSTHWAENFDEKYTDILELEDSISEQVTNALIPQLATGEKQKLSRRETDNPNAYEAYLKGRYHWNQFTAEALPKALTAFEKAVELDPNYALAYVGMADFYVWANIYGLIPSEQALAEAEKYARQAVELDENLGEGYATLGLINQNRKNWAEAEKLKLKAIQLAPNYHLTHEWYAAQLRALGRDKEADREILTAEKLDPLSRRTKTQVAWIFYQGHKFEETLKRGQEIIELDKNYPTGYMQIAVALWGMKRFEEALPHFRKFNEMIPDSGLTIYPLCFGLVKAGKSDEARKVLERLKAQAQKTYIKPYFLAMAHAALGEFDEAFALFEQSLNEDDPWMMWLATDPMLEELRTDARISDFLRRMNNPLAEKYLPTEKIHLVSPKKYAEKSIAVLPLKLLNLADAGRDNYLSVGLTDAIITRLTGVKRLIVRPTASVLNFGNTGNLFEAGQQLNVGYLLAGSIQINKGKYRITAQLLDINQSATIWSQQFDENAEDIFELEDSISRKVVHALLPQLDSSEKLNLEKKYTEVREAYEDYLRGRYFWNKLTPEDLLKSLEMFESAISLDPKFALAHVGIADFYVWAAVVGLDKSNQLLKKAKAAAEKALEIDPTLIEANYALAIYECFHEHNQAKSETLLRRLIEANPNYWIPYELLAVIYIARSDFEKGIETIRKAESLNPLSTRSILSTAWCYYLVGDFAKAANKAQEALDLEPTLLQAAMNLANSKIHLSQPHEAIKLLETCLNASPNWTRANSIMAFALAAIGEKKKAEAIPVKLEKLSQTEYVSPFFAAYACVAVNQTDKAFEWLEKAYEERSTWLIWLERDVKFDSIRQDKRFIDLISRIKSVKTSVGTVSSKKPKTETAKVSLAVLPLQNIGETNTGDAFLSIGLADAMITRLSQVRRIIVRPTNTVLGYADCTDSFAAGRELNVDYVLCGMIRPAGNRIRISAQLLEVKTNTTIWSEKFDEDFTDVLELEDLVAEKVAKLLIPKLTTEEEKNLAKRNVRNVEAFEAFLRGKYHLFNFTPDDFAKAVANFERAIEIDPNYARAYAALSDCYFVLTGFAAKPPRESFQMVEKMAEKAIELDNTLGEAYANLGLVKCYNLDLQKGEEILKRGIELDPNQLNAYVWYSVFLTMQGRTEEAVAAARKVFDLGTSSAFHQYHYIWILYHNRRFDEALELIDKVIETLPDFSHGLGVVSWILRHLNKIDESIKYGEKACRLSPETSWFTANLAATYAKAGEREKAAALLQELEAGSSQYVSPFCLAVAYLYLGEKDKSLELIEKSVVERDVWFPWIVSDAQLDGLRNEPRLANLMRRLGVSPAPKAEPLPGRQGAKSIAVLPLQFIGEADTGETYLSVGLADAMITRLSRIKGLMVRPTSSIVRFDQPNSDPLQAGKELGVQFILEGHLKKFGNRLRVTVQLLDTAQNTTIWAETIDETTDDVLQLEDSICYKVLRSLTPHLTGEELIKFEKQGTSNPKAYEAYLRGRFHWHSYTVEGISKALICYYEAIAEDENFALPYSGVADYYNFLSIFGVMSPEESFPAAKEAALKAISLDENLAEAYNSLGITTFGYDWNFPKARNYLEKSLKLNPNSGEAHVWYGYLFSLAGKHERAIKEFEKAEILNPQSPSVPVSYALALRNARRFEKGLEKLRRALEIQPNNPTALQGFCWFVNALKNFEEAEAMCKKAVEVSGRQNLPLYAYGYTLASAGKRGEARKIVEELKERSGTQYVPPIYLALIYTALGEIDPAFEWLDKCFEVRDFWVIWLPIDPRFDALRGDKRFKEFCQRIQPLPPTDETIHQSQIPTKIFAADELKDTKPEEKKEKTPAKPTFFYRHKYKFAAVTVLLVLVWIGYAMGIMSIDFNGRRVVLVQLNEPLNKRSVAILPFKNETGNPENDFLCDGLSENLINRLTYLPEIQVMPRSASFKYKGKEISPQQAGTEMNVQTVVSGKVTKHDENIGIFVEFIDVKSGANLATIQYEGKNNELIAIQDKIAADAAKELKAGSLGDARQVAAKSFTQNPEAFELYLKGEFHRQKGSPEDTKKSIEFYKKALEFDPNYALAFQGLALAYRSSPAYGTLTPQEAYPLAKESAMKALAIDPTLGAVHIPLASIKFVWDWDFAGAESEYKQAIQLAPNNPETHSSYGNFLVAMGRFDEALNELKIAQQFDPLSPTISSNIAWALYIAGRFTEAEAQAKQIIAREPNFARAHLVLGEIYVEQGKLNEAIPTLEKAKQLSNEALNQMVLGHAYALAGRREEALKIAQDLEARVMKKEISPFLPAEIYIGLGDNDKAFYWLERAYQERSNWLALSKIGRRLNPLRGDPRFDDLLKRIGFKK